MPLTEQDRQILKEVARQAIAYGLAQDISWGRRPEMPVNSAEYSEALQAIRGCFVTLNLHDELHGCIGTLDAYQPLVIDVAHNAHAAAFYDPRFPPTTQQQLDELDIHISILNPAEAMQFDSEADLLRQLRPGIDGLILEDGGQRGTFLPVVWESLKTPEEFLLHLKYKAGLPANYWSNSLKISRYTTESF
jgi:AmmeMemoRadiSam system protein A